MPSNGQTIKFLYGVQANFDKIQASLDANTVYFITDTQRLYVGDKEYTRPVLSGAGAPTDYVPPRSLYYDTTNKVLYMSPDLDTSGAPQSPIQVSNFYAHPNFSALTLGPTTGGDAEDPTKLAFGDKITIPGSISVNSQGHVTAGTNYVFQLPDAPADAQVTVTQGTAGDIVTGVTKGTGATEVVVNKTSITDLGLAKESDLTEATGRITALEGKPAAGITSTQITNWDGEVGAKAAAEAAQATAATKVASVTKGNEGITIGGTATDPTVAVRISTSTGNVLEIDKANGGLYVPTPAAATVTGIKEGEKVLSLTGTELGTTLSLNYKNTETEKKIQLLGIDNALVGEIDATAFIKDGMLDSAELKVATAENPVGTHTSGTFLVLTFNTDAGKEEIDIDVSSLIDTYTADPDGGLSLTDHAFSIKKDPNSEGFLSVDAAGLKISGVQTAINTATDAVLGTDSDDSTKATVYGARKLAEEAKTAADTASSAAGKVKLVQSTSDGHKLTFTNSAGTDTDITIPDNDTTYTFAGGNGSFTVTPAGGEVQTVSIGKPDTAGTADKLATAREIALTGDAAGSANFDGSAAISIETTVSHSAAADQATSDGAGNNIVNTYATKTELENATAALKWGTF